MLPKIIRTGIHRYEGTGVRKTEMATQYRKAYVPVTLDVDKEGAILPRLIWWDNGVIFQIDQILYKCRATSKKVGGGGIRYTVQIRGKESFLFHEGDKWFVEAKEDNSTLTVRNGLFFPILTRRLSPVRTSRRYEKCGTLLQGQGLRRWSARKKSALR